MTTTTKPIRNRMPTADEEGNDLPPLDPNGPIAQIIYLLEYARVRGFRIGPLVQVGDVALQVADLRQMGDSNAEPQTSIWEEHGHKE